MRWYGPFALLFSMMLYAPVFLAPYYTLAYFRGFSDYSLLVLMISAVLAGLSALSIAKRHKIRSLWATIVMSFLGLSVGYVVTTAAFLVLLSKNVNVFDIALLGKEPLPDIFDKLMCAWPRSIFTVPDIRVQWLLGRLAPGPSADSPWEVVVGWPANWSMWVVDYSVFVVFSCGIVRGRYAKVSEKWKAMDSRRAREAVRDAKLGKGRQLLD